MSVIKRVSTQVKGKTCSVSIPDSKTVILRGRLNLQILFTVESLLARDFTGNLAKIDSQYRYHYEPFEGESRLEFLNGVIIGANQTVKVEGEIPKIHCIRYLGNGFEEIRSFLLSETAVVNRLYTNTVKYTSALSPKSWVRMIAMVNSVVGYQMVTLTGTDLKFNFESDDEIDEEGKKLIYLLISECFLTPDDYTRVVILPDISCLYPEVQVKLLDTLDNIAGHSLTLSAARLQPSDILNSQSIKMINI